MQVYQSLTTSLDHNNPVSSKCIIRSYFTEEISVNSVIFIKIVKYKSPVVGVYSGHWGARKPGESGRVQQKVGGSLSNFYPHLDQNVPQVLVLHSAPTRLMRIFDSKTLK